MRANDDRVVAASFGSKCDVAASKLVSGHWASSFTPHCLCLSDETFNSCCSLLYGVYDGGSKNVYRNIDFLNETLFLYQVLFSRMLSGLAIYLQNDLNFSHSQ